MPSILLGIARRIAIVLACVAPFASHGFCIGYDFLNSSFVSERYDAATDRFFLDWLSETRTCQEPAEHRAPAGTVSTGLVWVTPAVAAGCSGQAADPPLCRLARPMCEFVSTSGETPSVFLTINAGECEALKQPGSGWTYVPMPLGTFPPGEPSLSAYEVDPASGQCAAPTLPVYRFVHLAGLVNHRYVADPATRQQMRSRPGWKEEGVAFCVSETRRINVDFTDLQPWYVSGGSARISFCPNGLAFANRFCLQSTNMPPLLSTLTLPDVAGIAPYHDKTGAHGYLIASPSATADVVQHSFAQLYPSSFLAPPGYFLTYSDRVSGNVSSLTVTTPLDSFADGVPLSQPFAPVYDTPMDVMVSYRLFVKTIRAEGAGNHAYVQPLVTFIDGASGHRLVLSPGDIGTVAPMDLAVRDAGSGNALVSVALGTTTIGRSTGLPSLQAPKTFDAGNDWGWGGDFSYRINRDEFARAIAAARTVDFALGTDPARYGVESLSIKGEIVGQSSIGYNIERMTVSLVRPDDR